MEQRINPLKRARALSKMTVRQLAEKSGVNPNTISYLENDKQKAYATTLAKLADALEIPFETLLELLDEPKNRNAA